MRRKDKQVKQVDKCTVRVMREFLQQGALSPDDWIMIEYKPNAYISPRKLSNQVRNGDNDLILSLPFEMLDNDEKREEPTTSMTDEEWNKLSHQDRRDYFHKIEKEIAGRIATTLANKPTAPSIGAILKTLIYLYESHECEQIREVVIYGLHSTAKYLENKTTPQAPRKKS